MPAGRPPSGLNQVDRLDGSAESKRRLRVLLATLSGEVTLKDACARLGLGETRVLQLRELALQGALGALDPAPRGRPPKLPTADPERVATLEERLHELESDLKVERIRSDLAAADPRLLHYAARKKKARRRRKNGGNDDAPGA